MNDLLTFSYLDMRDLNGKPHNPEAPKRFVKLSWPYRDLRGIVQDWKRKTYLDSSDLTECDFADYLLPDEFPGTLFDTSSVTFMEHWYDQASQRYIVKYTIQD